MPVYGSHLLHDYEELGLGARIREVRQGLGLTLEELAKRTQMSMARLSRIENHIHVPNVDEAKVLAEALGVPWESLLPADAGIPYQVNHEPAIRGRTPIQGVQVSADGETEEGKHHNAFVLLADAFVGRHMDPALVRVMPLPDEAIRFYQYYEMAFGFVLKGTVELLMKGSGGIRREQMGPGDCVYYRSDIPHCLRALGDEPAETLHIRTSVSAPIETRFNDPYTVRLDRDRPRGRGDVTPYIGKRVFELRDACGWSLAQVAERAGLRERHVAQIEQGDRPVRLDVIMKLARAFGRPVHEFLGEAHDPASHIVVQRAAELTGIPRRRRRTGRVDQTANGRSYQRFAGAFPATAMFPYFVQFGNPDLHAPELEEHNGEEFSYLLGGELELTTYVAGTHTPEILRAGSALYLDSTVPHQFQGRASNPYAETSAETIHVFWCPLGEEYLFEPI